MDAKEYWNNYYREKPYINGKRPTAFLKQMLPRMRQGKYLDIGMGEGANAVYLAQEGHEVVGFDISDTAISHALAYAEESGVKISAKTADLDLYLMGVMEYDGAIMTYFRPPNPRYYTAIISALKQGGSLLIESYGVPQMSQAIGKDEQYKNYYYSSNEILHHLKDMRILFYQEGVDKGMHVVQCLAEKPIDKHAQKYDVFGMHAKGGTHQHAAANKQLELAEKFFKK